jgi:hypothetical protein
MKICKECKKELPESDFYFRKDRNVVVAKCKKCCYLDNKKTWAGLTDDERKIRVGKAQEWKDNQIRNGNFRVYLISKMASYKQSAKDKGLPFNLTVKYLTELFEKQNRLCYYTGNQLAIRSNRGLGEKCINFPDNHYQASLDRLIPSKGYVEGNVVWCGWLVNTCKNLLTENEFYDICDIILKRRKNKSLHAVLPTDRGRGTSPDKQVVLLKRNFNGGPYIIISKVCALSII